MKTPLVRLFATVLLACLLTACPETYVGSDFGYKPAVLTPARWNGVYEVLDDDDQFEIRVTDGPNGEVTLTEVCAPGAKKDKKDKPLVLTLRLATIGKEDRLYFATVHEAGEARADLPLYLLRTTKEGSLLLWSAEHKVIEAGIKAGQLKGNVQPDKDGPHSRLVSDPANYTLLLQPQYWDWMEPVVMKRRK